MVIDPATTDGLRDLATRRNTSLSNVVLALFELLLFRISGQEDLCVSMVVANRGHPDLETMLGCFVNILPIRTRLVPDMEFDQLLDHVAASTFEALEHQTYPFDLLVRRLDRGGGSMVRPFLDVIYAFQSGRPSMSISAPGGRTPCRHWCNPWISPSPSQRPSCA